ncbi:MAG: PGPGW domain-containing protein [Syntrophales bacterium]
MPHRDITRIIESIHAHEAAIWWIAGTSVVTFIATLIVGPWLIVRIPPDYFAHGRRHRKHWASRHPIVRGVLLSGKNLLGYILIAAGIAMLVLPGQGMMTILLGITGNATAWLNM